MKTSSRQKHPLPSCQKSKPDHPETSRTEETSGTCCRATQRGRMSPHEDGESVLNHSTLISARHVERRLIVKSINNDSHMIHCEIQHTTNVIRWMSDLSLVLKSFVCLVLSIKQVMKCLLRHVGADQSEQALFHERALKRQAPRKRAFQQRMNTGTAEINVADVRFSNLSCRSREGKRKRMWRAAEDKF